MYIQTDSKVADSPEIVFITGISPKRILLQQNDTQTTFKLYPNWNMNINANMVILPHPPF